MCVCIVQVGSVKEQIHSLKAFPLDGMKLIHAGNVLTDDRTVDSVGVKEGDFLVCVVRKAVRCRVCAHSHTAGV